jgi:hypothetical protein
MRLGETARTCGRPRESARRATLGAQRSGGDLSVWCCPPRPGHARCVVMGCPDAANSAESLAVSP